MRRDTSPSSSTIKNKNGREGTFPKGFRLSGRKRIGIGCFTFAGESVVAQLVALLAVALVGAVNVGALLVARVLIALVHVCRGSGYKMRTKRWRDCRQQAGSEEDFFKGVYL